MGFDKAFFEVDGQQLVQRSVHVLQAAGAVDVNVIGGDPARLRGLGLTAISDPWPGEGPLGAIIAGLDNAREDLVVILACDHAEPTKGAVLDTLAGLGHADVAVPVVAGRRQYLHAAWRRESRKALRSQFKSGARSVRAGLAELSVSEVSLHNERSTLDLDTPDAVLSWRAERHHPATLWPDGGQDVQVPQVTIDELESALQAGAMLIDVRELDELEHARVDGGIHIPLATVVDRVAEVPLDTAVYVICATGGRSQSAADFYVSNGINAHNVMTGTNGWVGAGKPFSTGPVST